MRIVIVAPEDLPIPPRMGGSVQIYLHALCNAIPNESHLQVTLLHPGHRHPNIHDVRRIPISGGPKTYLRNVTQQLTRLQPDVVQIDNRPQFVSRVKRTLPKARIILNMHSITFLGPRHLPWSQARKTLQCADTVVVNSQYLRREIARKFSFRESDWNARVIHPGVDVSHFRAPRETTSVKKSRTFHVIYVGRVIQQKGVHVLVSAVRHLQRIGVPVHLTIVGRTPPWESAYGRGIHQMIRRLPIRWIGFVSPKSLPKLLWKAHVLVCPSQRSEAFGLVNVEAMAAGLPVIASKHGGIPEVVNSTCGILIPTYRDAKSFAAAIRKLALNPDERHHLQEGAKRRAAQFTWKTTARQFTQLYRTTSIE